MRSCRFMARIRSWPLGTSTGEAALFLDEVLLEEPRLALVDIFVEATVVSEGLAEAAV
jgi:hypothetical protein